MSRERRKQKPRPWRAAPKPTPGVDPSLRPFISALARLLADDEERQAEARRALRKFVEGDATRPAK